MFAELNRLNENYSKILDMDTGIVTFETFVPKEVALLIRLHIGDFRRRKITIVTGIRRYASCGKLY